MAKIKSMNIIEIRGKQRLQFYDEKHRIVGSLPFVAPQKKVMSSTENRSRGGWIPYKRLQVREEQTTKRFDFQKLRKVYAGLRMAQSPNLYSAGGMINGNGGLIMAVAHKGAQVIKQGLDFGADIYSASTGETMRASNFKNIVSKVLHPSSLISDQIAFALDNMRIKRENRSLEYNRELTGNIIYSKNKGKY